MQPEQVDRVNDVPPPFINMKYGLAVDVDGEEDWDIMHILRSVSLTPGAVGTVIFWRFKSSVVCTAYTCSLTLVSI